MSVHEVKLKPSEIDAIVSRVAELLQSRRAARPVRPQPRMVTAAEVARWCGVERSWVYAHAEELGARKIGTGERPRIRFDLAEVSERIAALDSSQGGFGRGSTAIAADSRKRSLPRPTERYCRQARQNGRAARKRPRPGAEDMSFDAMISLAAAGAPAAAWRPRQPGLRRLERGGDRDGS